MTLITITFPLDVYADHNFIPCDGGGDDNIDEDDFDSRSEDIICTPENPCGWCCHCAGHGYHCCLCGDPDYCPGCCICDPGNCPGCCWCEGRREPWPPDGWWVFFSTATFKTCWHWNKGSPWSANPTRYALLDWNFTGGTVIDSLISPVVNLETCTTATLCCSTYFDHKSSGYTAKLVGSRDGGATYPYLIKNYTGYDFGPAAESFNIKSWAAGCSRVRFAWVYTGGVNKIHFWALDNVRIKGSPRYKHDIAVTEIRKPKGSIPYNTRVQPKVVVNNYGIHQETLKVYCKIDQVYTDSVYFAIRPARAAVIRFDEWLATLGNHTVQVYTALINDKNKANDTMVSIFQVVSNTWLTKERALAKIKSGGSIVLAKEKIYALTGYPNMGFLRYIPDVNQWRRMASPPHDADYGAGLTWAIDSFVYMLEGGEKQRFYRYNMKSDIWVYLANTPAKIGNGGALVWTGGDYLYALRGSETKSFYRYRISTNSWSTLAETPAKIGAGGALAWDRGNYLYALRGSNEQDFYRYQIDNNTWTTKYSTPANVSRGGSLAYDTVNNKVFAFRGKTTNQFWVYNPGSNSWSNRANTPQPVHTGGAITYFKGSIFGLRGDNERNFWNYALQVGGDFEGYPPDTSKEEGPGITLSPWEVAVVLDSLDKGRPVFSPDDNWVCYQKLDTVEGYKLYKIQLDGSEETQLTNDEYTYESPQWSSDGNWIVCVREDGICKIGSDGFNPQVLASGICADPQWSPDGSQILYTKWDGSHKLFVVSADGSNEQQLNINDQCDIRFPQWSPDGEWIVYQKLVNETYQIYKLSMITSEEVQLTNDIFDNTNPVFLDINWIIYEKVDENDNRQIYKIPSEGGEQIPLTTEACDHENPKIAGDGTWIAYVKWIDGKESHICKYTIETTSEEVLTDGEAVREYQDISNDGTKIVYERNFDLNDQWSDNRSIFMVNVNSTGIDEKPVLLPKRLVLYQNQPNPTKGSMTIRYEIPVESKISLKIYDGSGRLVRTLIDELVKPGSYSVCWNRKDNDGKEVPFGIYFYRLYANDKCLLKKAVLLK